LLCLTDLGLLSAELGSGTSFRLLLVDADVGVLALLPNVFEGFDGATGGGAGAGFVEVEDWDSLITSFQDSASVIFIDKN